MDIKKEHTKIVVKASDQTGVEDLMKVYQRFKEANSVTEHYLHLISPKTFKSNSNRSLMA
jgi:tetrahydromethanopterin S-methyltransferase subunit B